ncbi:hypothetical protein DFH08DRAFT_827224 [Mycena albidolilacea]|uniref:Uncharacterized protein n=1 Tax=Mycena albidolilacea TaxID=1033008 RepID=A0AAD6YZ80_9AGAR|nr:hypothetical protein DFH08DRAFT_827224 [Mycena albidolilacea]
MKAEERPADEEHFAFDSPARLRNSSTNLKPQFHWDERVVSADAYGSPICLLVEIGLSAAGFNVQDQEKSFKKYLNEEHNDVRTSLRPGAPLVFLKQNPGEVNAQVDIHKVSDSKVKLEGQEEIWKVGGDLIRQVSRCYIRSLQSNFSTRILPYICMENEYPQDSDSNVQQGAQKELFKVSGGEYKRAKAEHRKKQEAEEAQRARNAKLARHQRREMEEAERIRKAQRDRWKAVSVRYYLKHPEIKEKKRAKMAEKRAARKLACRRWDPPKAARKSDGDGQLGDFSATPDLALDAEDQESVRPTPDEALEFFLESASAHDTAETAETVAAASLLFLQTHRPHVEQSPGASGKAWGSLAPDYDSSDED